MTHAHNGKVIKDDSCKSWQHGKVYDLSPHKDMYECYDYNHEKVHIRRLYQKEIKQSMPCQDVGTSFSFIHFQIFYDCVYQFYNYSHNCTYTL